MWFERLPDLPRVAPEARALSQPEVNILIRGSGQHAFGAALVVGGVGGVVVGGAGLFALASSSQGFDKVDKAPWIVTAVAGALITAIGAGVYHAGTETLERLGPLLDPEPSPHKEPAPNSTGRRPR